MTNVQHVTNLAQRNMLRTLPNLQPTSYRSFEASIGSSVRGLFDFRSCNDSTLAGSPQRGPGGSTTRPFFGGITRPSKIGRGLHDLNRRVEGQDDPRFNG
jgi:hypothetical protein